jgi:hypothetical protein
MSDRAKGLVAALFFILALILPLIGLGIGWWKWDIQTGLLIMVATFILLFCFGVLLLFRITNLSWLTVSLPYVFGALYTVMPDVIPFSVDDAAATTAGAIFSFTLALRKVPDTPKWIFIPLLAAGIYTLVGGTLFPGPMDEALVDIFALILAWLGARRTPALEAELGEDEF